ncbi:MAG: hypothetical protein AAGA18_04425 [Verrucomicrobiota bacterium]
MKSSSLEQNPKSYNPKRSIEIAEIRRQIKEGYYFLAQQELQEFIKNNYHANEIEEAKKLLAHVSDNLDKSFALPAFESEIKQAYEKEQQALKQTNLTEEELFELIKISIIKQRHQMALKQIKEFITRYPNTARRHEIEELKLKLSRILTSLGSPKLPESLLKKTAQMDDKELWELSQQYIQSNNLETAILILENLINKFPQSKYAKEANSKLPTLIIQLELNGV